ncbi:uncharacterized protein FIBRA_08306 [Fibroporia radiculosa]|uniref:Extracellular membrane protein CFEM domain-containing protein n=1 Tax=Fibroporia radiculosa TaxID=599839 RepID=J4H537_9APHY|nr:uncharacterized protein FIBRA_08306 [Fibroporia radiculosa]CCM06059.1 predicted protein [Fibroporia radiculosa]
MHAPSLASRVRLRPTGAQASAFFHFFHRLARVIDTSARSCLQANCTSADLQAAEALQSTECAAANSSSSAASSTSTSGSSTSSAPATTSTTTKSGAGLAGVDAHVVMGAAVAMVGMLAGMGLVL